MNENDIRSKIYSVETEIKALNNKMEELKHTLRVLNRDKMIIDEDVKNTRNNVIAQHFYDEIMKNGGIKVGRQPIGYCSFIGYSYDIKSYSYPLVGNEALKMYKLGMANSKYNQDGLAIIGVKEPYSRQEQQFYPYVVEYMKNKLPLSVYIKPEIEDYEPEKFLVHDLHIHFYDDGPKLILHYIQR